MTPVLANASIAALAGVAAYRRDLPLAAASIAWLAGAADPSNARASLALYFLPLASGSALAWYRLARWQPWPIAAYIAACVGIAVLPAEHWSAATRYGSAPWIAFTAIAVVRWLRRSTDDTRAEHAALVIALGDLSGVLGLWGSTPDAVPVQALVTALFALLTQID